MIFSKEISKEDPLELIKTIWKEGLIRDQQENLQDKVFYSIYIWYQDCCEGYYVFSMQTQ